MTRLSSHNTSTLLHSTKITCQEKHIMRRTHKRILRVRRSEWQVAFTCFLASSCKSLPDQMVTQVMGILAVRCMLLWDIFGCSCASEVNQNTHYSYWVHHAYNTMLVVTYLDDWSMSNFVPEFQFLAETFGLIQRVRMSVFLCANVA